MRGLLGRRPPGPRSGLLLAPCRAVHTFGMRHAIDVVFVARDRRVVKVCRALAPCRVALCLGAVAVVEVRAGAVDAEHGGIRRIEAAIEHACRGDRERDLQRAGQLRRQAEGDQQPGAQVQEQGDQDPGGGVDQEGPLVAPAGDAGKEQRLRQPQTVPGDQDRRIPEQRRDHDVDDRENDERGAQGHQDGFHAVLDGRDAHAFREGGRERQEGGEPGRQADGRVQQAHQEQLAENPRLLERLGPHRGQHDPVRVDVFAGRQAHQRDRRHQGDEQDRADDLRGEGENDQETVDQRPGEHGQGLLAEQAEAVSDPLPAGRRGEECCLHGSLGE
ncbi:DUF192 domain-containing protein [Achromobacter deleyi]|uniref:DUF192 domain-containing protein n=1 Tax=Achromobacter deleyi TaxID=1353891 RepID=A0A7T4B9V4_9BURK|nr:DUF192 domain-containing protein [Achromobacter deleyi]